MKSVAKKILVIHTGGTFGMWSSGSNASEKLFTPNLTAAKLKTALLKQVPEMMKIASCTVKVMFNTDSCQIQPQHWFELAAHIFENQKKFDGIVILHGTDTLPYTASALSMLLSPTQIPVVITGAQKPLANLRNDARQNFISALEIAANAPQALRNRVLVLFHDELFLGTRVRKKSAVDFSAFESPRFPSLATIGSEVIYHDSVKHLPKFKRKNSKKPLLTEFRGAHRSSLPQILSTQVTPSFCLELFSDEAVLEKLNGILLTLYASGTAPTKQKNFIRFLQQAQDSYCPIFAITEREHHIASLGKYSAGRELIENHVLWCNDLTPEAAFVKIWLLCELNPNLSRHVFYDWLQKNWSKPISDETLPRNRA